MKKLIFILAVLLVITVIYSEVYKEVNFKRYDETVTLARINYAWETGENSYGFNVTFFNADSVMLSDNNYFSDTNAPFILETEAELDTLLKLHPNYIPVLEEE